MNTITILAIESSCDDTSASVYSSIDGVRSNVTFSQNDLHGIFGGVVPEIASRAHLEKIGSTIERALEKAHRTLDDIDIIAVTNKPGLPGSLLVGLNFAKSLAYARSKKLIGVNHLEGHAFSASIEHQVPFPFLCFTASGGHTSLYRVTDFGKYESLSTTRDDAAGEAFDKIAKLMNLPYPGGPIIEKMAESVDFFDFFKYPRLKNPNGPLSFSGLKTAVLYDLVRRGAYDLENKKFLASENEELKKQVASSLLVCIADIFEQKLERTLAAQHDIRAITFVGGVACNKYIKARLQKLAQKHHKEFFAPSPQYCTDNAAMIAFVAHYKAQLGEFDDLSLDIY